MIDHTIYTLSMLIATALLAYVVLWSGLQTFNANPSKRFMRIWPKLALYYAAYTMPIWALLLVIDRTQNVTSVVAQLPLPLVLIALAAMGLYFYTVIVQPNRLRIHRQTVDIDLKTSLNVAVLADLRIGLYSGKPRHIRKLVATINELSVDAVLITGDWLYYPGADLVGQLMLFKGVNKPIYTVMSISDLRYQSMNTTKQGQPLLEDTLACAFDVLDITYIGQQCRLLPPIATHLAKNATPSAQPKSSNLTSHVAMLCGWQDMPSSYKGNSPKVDAKQTCKNPVAKTSQLPKPTQNHAADSDIIVVANKADLCTKIEESVLPVIILASRFDSITDLPKALKPRPLLIAAAAKSAKSSEKLSNLPKPQRTNSDARIKSAIFSYAGFDNARGLYQHASAQVFVSSGIGTRGLPFRLRRPTIDVLTIR
ncbi:hypothetical protein [uncultured Psychrobacter sp.]|uniref:hypothetical protein n=1 Tax=uncultured Psychrobacter sp. TaxID=259303 RepID=UPI00262D313C|nr:hypothetical protein [uncultured Psychrobacter sp.]